MARPLRLQKQVLGNLLHWPASRPQFVAFCVGDLPTAATEVARRALGLPVLTWTVRTREGPRAGETLGRPDDLRGLPAGT